MLNKKQKEEVVSEIAKKFAEEKIALFSQIRGIPVAKLNAFRRELKKIGAELKITKKTLLKRALEPLGLGVNPRELEGEIGVIFGYENQVDTAKLAQKFSKQNETFKIPMGLLEKKILSAEELLALAKLPPKERLLAMLAHTLASPLRGLVNVLQANQKNLVVVLNKVKSLKTND